MQTTFTLFAIVVVFGVMGYISVVTWLELRNVMEEEKIPEDFRSGSLPPRYDHWYDV